MDSLKTFAAGLGPWAVGWGGAAGGLLAMPPETRFACLRAAAGTPVRALALQTAVLWLIGGVGGGARAAELMASESYAFTCLLSTAVACAAGVLCLETAALLPESRRPKDRRVLLTAGPAAFALAMACSLYASWRFSGPIVRAAQPPPAPA